MCWEKGDQDRAAWKGKTKKIQEKIYGCGEERNVGNWCIVQ